MDGADFLATHFLIDFGLRKFLIESCSSVKNVHYLNTSLSLSRKHTHAHPCTHTNTVSLSFSFSQNINTPIQSIHHSIYSLPIPFSLSHIMIFITHTLSLSPSPYNSHTHKSIWPLSVCVPLSLSLTHTSCFNPSYVGEFECIKCVGTCV